MAEKRSLFRRLLFGDELSRSLPPWQGQFNYAGNLYPYGQSSMTLGSKQEAPQASFLGYVQWAYYNNAVVFACMETRALLFSEARFQYRRLRSGRPGDLFGSPDLEILERPSPNETTGDLLKRAIQDADGAGNYYAARQGNRIFRMRPDWVTIILGSNMAPDDPALALDAEVAGYAYQPGGYGSGLDPVLLLPEQVCHFAPVKDPIARFRGMSWLTPLVREVMGDSAMTDHRLQFFENGATVNLFVKFGEDVKTKEQFADHVDRFNRGHRDVSNAYKTLFGSAGMDVSNVGADLEQIDFKVVQGAGETRIAAAARTPPIMVGLSEGLSSATYSNYGQARRAFADLTMRPLWRMMAASLSSIVDVPPDAELWYDDRDIPFLQEDVQDEATIQATQATTIRSLLDAGFEAESVKKAVIAGDFSLLVHSGLFSVQLQPPGTTAPEPSENGVPQLPIGVEE